MKRAWIAGAVAALALAGCSTTAELRLSGPEALLRSAEVEIGRGNWILAERRVLAAAEIYRVQGNKKGQADCYFEFGKLTRMTSEGKPEQVRRALEQQTRALELYQEADWQPGAAVAHAERAHLHALLGDKTAACAEFREALRCHEEAVRKNPSFSIPVYNPRARTFVELVGLAMAELGCETGEATAAPSEKPAAGPNAK